MLLESDIVSQLYSSYKPSQNLILGGSFVLLYISLIWFTLIYYFANDFYRNAKYGVVIAFSIGIATTTVFICTLLINFLLGFSDYEVSINQLNIIIGAALYGCSILPIALFGFFYFVKHFIQKKYEFNQIILSVVVCLLAIGFVSIWNIKKYFPQITKGRVESLPTPRST